LYDNDNNTNFGYVRVHGPVLVPHLEK